MRKWAWRLVRMGRALALIAPLMLLAPSARAELVLSQLVLDLAKPSQTRADIEVWNNSDERIYVVAEPSEIVNAGTAGEQRRVDRDPEQRGLLVSPARMILEPGQRKLIRIATIGPRPQSERVYRITVKPVAGELTSSETGLKLLVGYDVLVLLRPSAIRTSVSAVRSGSQIIFRNDGNSSVELIDGKQCAGGKANCKTLPGKRLYAGASWSQQLSSGAPVEYTLVSNGQSTRKIY